MEKYTGDEQKKKGGPFLFADLIDYAEVETSFGPPVIIDVVGDVIGGLLG